MRLQSLKSKLLLAVSALVIGSGILISLVVTQRYSKSLFEAVTAQTENLAHAVALEATDKILVNDLVALQKMLDHQLRSNPSIAYLFILRDDLILAHTFILRDDLILAHTFTEGVPVELISANRFVPGEQDYFQEIASTSGEHYLDIAWPIFGGNAGILRLGLTEKP